MNNQERLIITAILILIAALVAIDVLTDLEEGVVVWHVLIEGAIGVAALVGIFFVARGSYQLRHRLHTQTSDFSKFREEARVWQAQSRKYIEGLSGAIDSQLERWNLTDAEKEVAFLLLKGLSLKEVASVRSTSEKTARVQSTAIYAKSGLTGRSELAAFFLEDLLVPNSSVTEEKIPMIQ